MVETHLRPRWAGRSSGGLSNRRSERADLPRLRLMTDTEMLMPLVPMAQLLTDARRGGYAVCYCEAWNLESLQAVLEAAEETHSPIIAGFNGGFLMNSGRAKPEKLSYYAGMGLAVRESTVPAAFLLNETDNISQLLEAMDKGFNAVMVENEHLDLEGYRRLVKSVVQAAHAKEVSVEAQVGRLPSGWEGAHSSAQITDPVVAREFVEETGIDVLGVSIGNVHVLTKGKASIDLEAVRKVSNEVNVPLAVHGGTGFPAELARDVISLGVAKFNFGTVLKQAYLAAIPEKLKRYREPLNPHPFLGMGGEEDILVAGREAVKEKVKELLRLYGSAGKASADQPSAL